MKEYLLESAKKINIPLSEEQLRQFEVLFDFMIEKNKVMNLTAITEEKDVVMKHFIDSITLMKYFSFEGTEHIIDVGTGAGFPGIPLAIMFPKISFTLMDSLNKRIVYLKELAEQIGLNNVECIHSRAEELGKNYRYREKYDICVSRAVASLPILLEYCVPFIKKQGYFISYKSLLAEEELSQSENAQRELFSPLVRKEIFAIPGTEYNRCFLFFQKKKELPKKYPRQNGMPKKKPL